MKDLLSNLPNMNSLLEHSSLKDMSPDKIKYGAAIVLDKIRKDILSGTLAALPDIDDCAALIRAEINERPSNLQKVINATGVVLHTNLGRAPLGKEFIDTLIASCSGYNNLEYDLKTGQRGSRYAHVEELICELIGTESAMVVNNNAAAMMLILAALAKDKKVAISRGELVEIGGSFRVPEVIVQGGAELVEVGATNKTKLSDYIDAVENKGAEVLLKVHTSNYEVVGFTASVSISELSEYGKSVGLPVIYDIGSCFLIDAAAYGFNFGESASQGLRAGADVVCFSGDKLLGSSQAGIIAGRADLISKMKKHPLNRALRPDKLTLTVLEASLRQYRFPDEAADKIPTLSMMFAKQNDLKAKALALADILKEFLTSWNISVVDALDETGGGSLPNVTLPGAAVAIIPDNISLNTLEHKLRLNKVPIIIRIQGDMALISLRTLLPGDEDIIINALKSIGACHD